MESRNATGGGTSEIKTELPPLEERGLEVWGKVAVTGTPLVNITGGIKPLIKQRVEDLSKKTEQNESFSFSDQEEIETITILGERAMEEDNQEENNNLELNQNIPTSTPQKINRNKFKLKKPKVQTSLNETAEQLKLSYEQQTNVLNGIANSLNLFFEAYQQRTRTEEKRLKFDIQKFKFQHEDFQFDEMGNV